MFASLVGFVQKKYNDYLILSVNGVGYKVYCSNDTLERVQTGHSCFMYIETSVGEDFIKLYGFLTDAERNWFLCLSSVQGVGGKAALSILSVASPEVIADAILFADKAVITKANGVGPKLADRIINELKVKKDLPKCYDDQPPEFVESGIPINTPAFSPKLQALDADQEQFVKTKPSSSEDASIKRKAIDSATSALMNLGYSRTDSLKAVLAVQDHSIDYSESILIANALKHIAQMKEDV